MDMASIKLYDQNMNLETLQNWMEELNTIRTEDGNHHQYKVTIPVLLCLNMEEFLFEQSYQLTVLKWVFEKENYKKTIPFIVYHALTFEDRNRIREYYMKRMREDGIDVEWDILKSGEDLEQWMEQAPIELQGIYNTNWREHFSKLNIKDTVGLWLDQEYDPTIRQLLLQVDMI